MKPIDMDLVVGYIQADMEQTTETLQKAADGLAERSAQLWLTADDYTEEDEHVPWDLATTIVSLLIRDGRMFQLIAEDYVNHIEAHGRLMDEVLG